jgi:ubiquitin-like-conjugating enzyme ATG3
MSRFLFNAFHSARQYLTPTLTVSRFHEEGQLTPEEFERSGDYLTRLSPTWSWHRGLPSYSKSYLPPSKQYLVMMGAMCYRRVRDLTGGDLSGGGGDAYDFDTAAAHPALPPSPPPHEDHITHAASDDDEYGEMASFIDPSLLVSDPSAVSTPKPALLAASPESRRYEITIAYDNAYRTPRVYLRGFQADTGRPLSTDEMMDDVMQDYVAKTATIEAHPHSGEAYLSIHPCRHAQTMRRLVENMIAGGDVPPVELYLFIFLKFIGSMIPTIDYDLTMPISIGPATTPDAQ